MTIYLDYAATTPVDPMVAAAMGKSLGSFDAQANAASATHGPGLAAHERVAAARAMVAGLVGAEPRELVFTSGATESNNLALLGVAAAARRAGEGGHFVSARTEHKSVLDPLKQLQRDGFAVTLVDTDASGRTAPAAIAAALRADTRLVSVMLANNETGVINDVAALGAPCRARGVLLHCDASQAVGKLPVDVAALGVDLLSFTAHKFYGPKGIGALYVRESARPRLSAVQWGGGHERGLRSGTLPNHQIEGFAAAAWLVRDQHGADAAEARALSASLIAALEAIPGVTLNGHRDERVPGIVNVSFEGVEGESLVTGLTELAVSTGSACSSATREPSYVLRALGRSTELAQSSLRLSFGRFTTAAELDAAVAAIRRELSRLRQLAGGEPLAGVTADPPPEAPDSLLGRTLSPLAQRYFRVLPRPPAQAAGAARAGHAGRCSEGTEVGFTFEIDAGIVKNARFQAYGCPHTLAVTAWLAERLEGADPATFEPGTPAGWAETFAVPVEKLGRLLIVEDALRAALKR